MPVLAKTQREAIVTIQKFPVRLSPAEESLVAQLESAGAKDAADRLRDAGLPTRRVESYHYTDLKMLLRDVPALSGDATDTSPPALHIPGAFRILMANGAVQETTTAPAGVIVGKVKGSVLSARDDAVVRLNTALAKESLSIDLDHSVDPIIHIDRRTEGPAGHVNGGAKFFVADGGSATIVETFSGSDAAHLGNHASYVSVGKGANVTHIMIDLSGPTARHFGTAEYEIAADARLRTLTIHAGSAVARTQLFARFSGEGAHADFTGLNLVEDGQHADITLDIAHAVPNTTSAELFKSVARGRSRAVFQGKIVVAQHAQKTDAKMMAQGLMLSDTAEILAKPELEIFADDVVCGHGATCGEIDSDSLFYLLSRGIPRPDAESMLVRAFLDELFDPIEDAELNEALLSITDGWLARAIPQASL